MTVAILSVGTELLRGEVVNTNASWLGEQLTEQGHQIGVVQTVGDDPSVLKASIEALTAAHPIVVVTGGLGPTTDDLTAAAAAAAAGVELVENEAALDVIRRRVADRGGELRPGHRKQAQLPAGSEVLPNGAGSAPGFAVRYGASCAYFMPGVPREMREMFQSQLVPRIAGTATRDVFQITLRTYGQGESWIAVQLAGVEADHPTVTLGYRVHSPEVDVKVLARARDDADARSLAHACAEEVRARLGAIVYGEGDDTLWGVAGRGLRRRGWRLATAESCTGGRIAERLCAVPASDFYVGGVVAYANTAKTDVLGVSEDTLRGHGAVSAEVAAEMAEGARRAFECDIAVSVTGIAGPTGATPDKPLGLCHWAVASPSGTVVEQRVFGGDRNQVQNKAAHAAVDLLRRTVI